MCVCVHVYSVVRVRVCLNRFVALSPVEEVWRSLFFFLFLNEQLILHLTNFRRQTKSKQTSNCLALFALFVCVLCLCVCVLASFVACLFVCMFVCFCWGVGIFSITTFIFCRRLSGLTILENLDFKDKNKSRHN